MITFFDLKTGRPVCYSNNGIDYFDYEGMPYAYVRDNHWYSYNDGKWLGWQQDKWFYDANGNPLLFTT